MKQNSGCMQDSRGCMVVGGIGPENVGKSTLLSMICNERYLTNVSMYHQLTKDGLGTYFQVQNSGRPNMMA